MDGDAFLVYLRRALIPELRRGDLLVLDNLATHKVAGVREILAERRVHAFYLPPYSPDMNPIEMAFSKLKAILRQEPPRQKHALEQRIAAAIDSFKSHECADFFKAAGYQYSL